MHATFRKHGPHHRRRNRHRPCEAVAPPAANADSFVAAQQKARRSAHMPVYYATKAAHHSLTTRSFMKEPSTDAFAVAFPA